MKKLLLPLMFLLLSCQDMRYTKTTFNGRVELQAYCYMAFGNDRATKRACEEYIRENCRNGEVDYTSQESSGLLYMHAYCQE